MQQAVHNFFANKRTFIALFALAILIRVVTAVTIHGGYYSDEFSSFLEAPFQWLFPHFQQKRAIETIMAYRSNIILQWHYLLLQVFTIFTPYSPTQALAFLKIVLSLFSTITFFYLYKTSKECLPLVWARALTIFFGFWYYTPYFSNRLLSENYSLLFLAPAFYYLAKCESDSCQNQDRSKYALFSALLIALAAELRIQSAFFCVGPALYFLFKRRRQDFLIFCGTFWLAFLAGGACEYLTRGEMFSVIRSYYDINVTRSAIATNPRPFFHYLDILNVQFTEWFFPILFFGGVVGAIQRPMLGMAALGYALLHMLIPHKEVRFLYPMQPLVFVLFGVGIYHFGKFLEAKSPRLNRYAFSALMVIILSAQLFHVNNIAWDGGVKGASFNLIALAGTKANISEIYIFDHGKEYGYFTLNRDVPFIRDINTDKVKELPNPKPNAYVLVSSENAAKIFSWLRAFNRNFETIAKEHKMLLVKVL